MHSQAQVQELITRDNKNKLAKATINLAELIHLFCQSRKSKNSADTQREFMTMVLAECRVRLDGPTTDLPAWIEADVDFIWRLMAECLRKIEGNEHDIVENTVRSIESADAGANATRVKTSIVIYELISSVLLRSLDEAITKVITTVNAELSTMMQSAPAMLYSKNYKGKKYQFEAFGENFLLAVPSFNFRFDVIQPKMLFLRIKNDSETLLALTENPTYFICLPIRPQSRVLGYLFESILGPNDLMQIRAAANERYIGNILDSLDTPSATEMYTKKLQNILFANILPRLRANTNMTDTPCRIAMLQQRDPVNRDLFKYNFIPAFAAYLAKRKEDDREASVEVSKADRNAMYLRAETMGNNEDGRKFKKNSIGTEHFKYILGMH